MSKPPVSEKPPEIADEPGMAERFQRGLRRALNTPPKHRGKPVPTLNGQRAAAKRKTQSENG